MANILGRADAFPNGTLSAFPSSHGTGILPFAPTVVGQAMDVEVL